MDRSAEDIKETDLLLAIRRLDSVVSELEMSIDRYLEQQEVTPSINDEMADILLDRSRLIQSLDRAEAKSDRFEQVNKEVSHRLVNAMESIRSVMEKRAD